MNCRNHDQRDIEHLGALGVARGGEADRFRGPDADLRGPNVAPSRDQHRRGSPHEECAGSRAAPPAARQHDSNPARNGERRVARDGGPP
jgi:hypothetical protein